MEQANQGLFSLQKRIDLLAKNMEKMKLAEYIELLGDTKRLLWVNFISGIARGLGIAVGFTILGAILLFFLQKLVVLNLPVIGGFIAQVVQMVQIKMY
ncbi:conserved hypothetical protein [Desulforamulus reducens MI-1]|uniref:Uncharacterized protein n=1 Tax=Desulforamulus reducens (strain ATCC BAA-1160 / DSM 100696 / MI-1) TaxID=349161 RepID=A4J549_DESRM|nr:DUF5665 domain-containing protein [Desulforamulus reducens]ABO50202.1 conserved hypothetical protein [Desulforamulus reducens MI-1]